jgi:hypothetical protein
MDKKQEEKKEVTERIKTFEDAQRETGRPDVPEFENLPEDLRDYFKAQYKMIVIAEALNEGWKADWSNSNQKKWFPWLYMSSSGFAFGGTVYSYSNTVAGNGSRLCLKSGELATYAGKQFIEILDVILLK